MTPLTQTRIASSQADKHGNCRATCYCSILDRADWLEELSDIMEPARTNDEQRLFANQFLQPLGWTVLSVMNFDVPDEPMAVHSVRPLTRVACGLGPRGMFHAIVQLPDGTIHDPHPSGLGLTGHINRFDVLVKL